MGINILIADDLQFIKLVLRDLVEKAGFRVVGEASNGEEAVELYQEKRPDVVLIDITMPKMDGLDLTETIRRDPQLANIPVILLTAMDRDEDKQRGLQAGADAYLIKKSLTQEELIDTIQQLV